MRLTRIIFTAAGALLAASASLSAQARPARPGSPATEPSTTSGAADAETRRALGLLVSLSGNSRDTLGVLVSSVVPQGVADRAGIAEGNRIAELNGISFRVEPDDVGQESTEPALMRALARHLRTLRAGDPVAVRVYAAGRYRTVRLQVPRASVTQAVVSEPPPAAPALEGNQTPGPTLATVMEALGRIQSQLNQLSRGSDATERDGEYRGLPGLRITTIDDDLAQYFGEGSEQGVLVLAADASWSPLRAGDVIMLVDGEQADVARIRSALDGRRQAKLEVLRRRRRVSISVSGPGARE